MSIFRKRLWQDRLDAIKLYYKSPKFALLDLTFACISLFLNPYRTSRKFLQKRGEKNIYAYGETPYTTYAKIVKEAAITEEDTWLELGSGRGKGCFWLAHFVKCRVVGIEWIPQFVWIAQAVKILFQMKKCSFQKTNFEKADIKRASVIYLYGLWPDLEINPDVKVITTSEPLEGFTVLKSFWVRFPWGRTRAFVQKKSSH